MTRPWPGYLPPVVAAAATLASCLLFDAVSGAAARDEGFVFQHDLFVNPEIVRSRGEKEAGDEGCLSIPANTVSSPVVPSIKAQLDFSRFKAPVFPFTTNPAQ